MNRKLHPFAVALLCFNLSPCFFCSFTFTSSCTTLSLVATVVTATYGQSSSCSPFVLRSESVLSTHPNVFTTRSSFVPSILYPLRGGGGGYVVNDDSDPHDQDDQDEDSDTTTTITPGPLLDSVKSLFRLNADVKENALEEEQQEENVLADPTGRGGALIMTKKRSTVMDTSRVSTASSRLLPPDNDSNKSSTISDDSTATTTDAALSELEWGEDDDDDDDDNDDDEIEVVVEEEDDDDNEYEYEYDENESDMNSNEVDDDDNEDDVVVQDEEDDTTKKRIEEWNLPQHHITDNTVAPFTPVESVANNVAKIWWANVLLEKNARKTKWKAQEEYDDDDEEEEVEGVVVTQVEENVQLESESERDDNEISLQIDEMADDIKLEESKRTNKSKQLQSPKEQLEAIAEEEKQKEQEHKVEMLAHDIQQKKKVSSDSGGTDVEMNKQQPMEVVAAAASEEQEERKNEFVSSGYWQMIDKVTSFGFSTTHESLRLSRQLRSVRKATARVTGLHGVLSGKGRKEGATLEPKQPLDIRESTLDENDLLLVRRRIAAINKARELVKQKSADAADAVTAGRPQRRFGLFRRRNRAGRDQNAATGGQTQEVLDPDVEILKAGLENESSDTNKFEEGMDEAQRKERVQAIDKLIARGQAELLELQCEKDSLQRRPNPLYNYTTYLEDTVEKTTRRFNFPSQTLVDEYLQELFATGRLLKLNHTDLWKSNDFDDDEDDSIGDDLLTPSADAHKLYQNNNGRRKNGQRRNGNGQRRNGNGNGGGGSWLLRQSIGKGGSLGAKIGEAAETSGYQAVCNAVMAALARSLAGLHGINLMTHSDIRLSLEQSADLPPVGVNKNIIPGSEDMDNYAQTAIKNAIQKGSKRHKRRKSKHHSHMSEAAFIQRDAVVETLLSHCQISAPLLKLFPLAWQRGLIGNMIDLITAIVSDFAGGIQLQILGHVLTFSFKPITESDMIAYFAAGGFNSRRGKAREFEAAVRATAQDVREDLKFLDGWHERALGSGMLRDQLANLIARLVLTLTDEVLGGARMDLWSAQANGPRLVAGLEHRTTATNNQY